VRLHAGMHVLCVRVCEREKERNRTSQRQRQRGRQREGEGEGECICVCVHVCKKIAAPRIHSVGSEVYLYEYQLIIIIRAHSLYSCVSLCVQACIDLIVFVVCVYLCVHARMCVFEDCLHVRVRVHDPFVRVFMCAHVRACA